MNRTKETTLNEIPKQVVMHHLNSFLDNDLEALLSDYTDESVLFTPAASYLGLGEIRTFFMELSKHFPKQQSAITVSCVVASEDLVYIVWQAKTPTLGVPIGSDTFIIKNGKIHQQTFVGQLNFIGQKG